MDLHSNKSVGLMPPSQHHRQPLKVSFAFSEQYAQKISDAAEPWGVESQKMLLMAAYCLLGMGSQILSQL